MPSSPVSYFFLGLSRSNWPPFSPPPTSRTAVRDTGGGPDSAEALDAREQTSHGAVQVKGSHQGNIDTPPVASASQV